MAKGDELRFLPHIIIAGALALGIFPLLWLALQQGGIPQFDSSIWSILQFTLKQAALSTLLSVVPGLFIARALSRQKFIGRNLLLLLFALPMAVPAIVAVLAVTGIFGQAGLVPNLFSPYGLAGILMAHVFFNLPMAVRIFYMALLQVPEEGFKLAAQLQFSNLQVLRHVEWPVLKPVLSQTAVIIFLLCAASFVVVLTLGGATSTTLEVAIYQSLRMDFDPSRALALSLVQIALCACLVAFARTALPEQANILGLGLNAGRYAPLSLTARLIDWLLILGGALAVLPFIVIIIWRGLDSIHVTTPVIKALVTSLGLGFTSAVLATCLAWFLAREKDMVSRLLAFAGLILPPAVIATGWFLLLHRWGDTLGLTLAFIIGLNVLMALPYAVSALRAGQQKLEPTRRLQSHLGIAGFNALRLIEWPLLRRPLAQALLMAMVLSLGDLTAMTLLGNHGVTTLPSLLRSEMGHYRGADAEGTALLLLTLCAALTFVAHQFGERDA